MEAAWSELEAALGLKESLDLEQALSMLELNQETIARHEARAKETTKVIAQKDAELATLRAELGGAKEAVPPQ